MFPPLGASSNFEYPRGPLKRYHDDGTTAQGVDDESSMGEALYSSEHRNKRQQTLPFRTSPTARKSNPAIGFAAAASGLPHPSSAMTPPGSFSEDATSFRAKGSSGFGYHDQATAAAGNDAMADMDMDMTVDCEQHEHGRVFLSLGPDHDCSDRMPTPMQPTFAAQVRGNNWNGAAAHAIHAGAPSMDPPMQQPDATAETQNSHSERSAPRSLDHPAVMGHWSMVQNRSLPSPISEDGGEDATGTPSMSLDGSHGHDGDRMQDPDYYHDHDHDYESPFSTPRRTGAIASSPLPSTMGAASSPIRATMDGSDPAATPSPKKGHSRSRHTIIAWTHQPGMKKSFSIGYRADCEKCRNRVPGHFNHIVVS